MKILIAIGTRPEAIKLAPLVHEFAGRPDVDVEVCVTAQHRSMLDQALELFGIVPDYDLNLMGQDQTLAEIAGRILISFDDVLVRSRPDVVVVQGDTTTTLACALTAFYRRIKVAHVEAGLRTGQRHSPFPEEINRRVATVLSDWHFAPTERSAAALKSENVPESSIYVVGNTVVDALRIKAQQVRNRAAEFENRFRFLPQDAPMVLVTCHRRENFGDGLENICKAIVDLSRAYPDTHIVYPVHLNPNVREPVSKMLEGLANVHLVEPQDYMGFIWLMDRARLVLTDSGGVQEEAPGLGTPVVVMRDYTERTEAIDAGTAVLVGSDPAKIVASVSQLLNDASLWRRMATAENPFGDGHSCARIADILTDSTALSEPRKRSVDL